MEVQVVPLEQAVLPDTDWIWQAWWYADVGVVQSMLRQPRSHWDGHKLILWREVETMVLVVYYLEADQ